MQPWHTSSATDLNITKVMCNCPSRYMLRMLASIGTIEYGIFGRAIIKQGNSHIAMVKTSNL